MCGITGFIDKNPNYNVKDIASKMGQAIYHRGPDSDGIWQDTNYGVNLIHRRLAILDLSPAGHQPMLSESGRFIIVFNGEIYNFKAILNDLEAKLGPLVWRGHSDTEVILKAIEVYGFVAALQKMAGMFAIALWDREKNELLLARDRIGEKPLYYGYFNGVFGFSSEIKALQKHPKFNLEIDRNALGQLLLHASIPTPLSIFDGIKKLTPGSYICLSYAQILQQENGAEQKYWSLGNFESDLKMVNDDEVVNDLDKLLSDVIAEQMVADVGVGCFLSGGVDSSTIAALMQKNSSRPIHTFSIGFDNPDYNEAEFAGAVAKHLGTNHHELYITEKDALNIVPKIASIYDEPFADSSQLPTYLVSKLARQHVTVALSGDAGDELFAGYNRYLLADKVYTQIQKYPLSLRKLCTKILPIFGPSSLAILNKLTKFPVTNFTDKIYKLDSLLKTENLDQFYTALTGHWLNYAEVANCQLKNSLWSKPLPRSGIGVIEQMQYLDILGYLPDDILVKVDRAAMANSLETRVPFLNHRVVEFANSLPAKYKIRNGSTKWCLREVLYKYVPKILIERPKRGFAIPINDWLRGELKEWAVELLDPVKLKNQGYLNPQLVLAKLTAHLSGKANNGYYLWNVLMFQQWLNNLQVSSKE